MVRKPDTDRPRKRPARLHASDSHDIERCRQAPRRRRIERSDNLGGHGWIVGRSLGRSGRYPRLAVRYVRRLDIVTALHLLVASLIRLEFIGW